MSKTSYISVPNHPRLEDLQSFTVQAMIWPTTPGKGRQVIAAKFHNRDKPGFALVISEHDGSLTLVLGDGRSQEERIATKKPMLAREWYFVAASYDAKTQQVVLYQEPLVSYPLVNDTADLRAKAKTKSLGSNQSPLMFAAWRTGTGKGKLDGKYNGKIDSPRLANRALTRTEMEVLKNGTIPPQLLTSIVGAWDFSRDIPSATVSDISPNLLHIDTSLL